MARRLETFKLIQRSIGCDAPISMTDEEMEPLHQAIYDEIDLGFHAILTNLREKFPDTLQFYTVD